MSIELFANSAQTTLTAAIDNVTTTVPVASNSNFPITGTFRIRIDNELMMVTGVSGTSWTVTRPIESTTAAAHSSGATVTQVLTAGVLTTYLVPTGALLAFAGTSAPTGWLACDGSAVSRTTYANLFSVIGTTWGVGDGSTTFNVPDFRRRVSVGSGGTGTGTLGNAVGNTGGEETHTLVASEIASHNHQMFSTGDLLAPRNTTGGSYTFASGVFPLVTLPQNTQNNTGGDGAHNNMQPSAVVLMCIKT